MPMPTRDAEVLIVGAGVAGLTAGCLLAQAGQRVIILEARTRVGGRIWTERVSRATPDGRAHLAADPGPELVWPLELGAEFIHGTPPEIFQVLSEAGRETFELDGDSFEFRGTNLQPVGDSDPATVLREMSRWLERQPAGTDMSFAEYLERRLIDADQRALAVAYVEGFNAANAHVIGIAALAHQQKSEDAIEGERLFRVTDGYDTLPEILTNKFLSAGGILRMQSEVMQVQWQRHDVQMTYRNAAGALEQLRAARAVVAVPLGVLQARAGFIQPAPPGVQQAISQLAVGYANRVSLLFDECIWTRDARCEHLSFLFAPGRVPATWWTPAPMHIPALVGWSGGHAATQAPLWRDPGQGALEQLSHILRIAPQELEQSLRMARFHDWSRDDYSLGAYSHVPAGAMAAAFEIGELVNDTLVLAGEHVVESGHWGTVHGAMQSGARAARRFIH